MDRDAVLSALARMTRKKPQEIPGHASLATLGLSSSFGLTALRSLLESQGKAPLPPFHPNMQVDALVQLVGGLPGAPPTGAPPAMAAVPAAVRPVSVTPQAGGLGMSLGLGMDMQEIGLLPETDDYRSHPFYAANFTPQELATSALRPDPRAHLCGLFCAKEAAKKSHAALLGLPMSDFCVLPDEAGRPILRLTDPAVVLVRLRFLVSITHTATVAAATCVTLAE